MGRKGPSREDKDRIIQLRKEGFSFSEIAESTGLTYNQVVYAIRCDPSIPPEKKRVLSNEKREQIIALRLEGHPNRDIADWVGCSVGTVQRTINRAREKEEIPSQPAREKDKRRFGGHVIHASKMGRIEELFCEGLSLAEIAEKTRASKATVGLRLSKSRSIEVIDERLRRGLSIARNVHSQSTDRAPRALITPAQEAQVIEMRHNESSVDEIRRTTGISNWFVQKILKKAKENGEAFPESRRGRKKKKKEQTENEHE